MRQQLAYFSIANLPDEMRQHFPALIFIRYPLPAAVQVPGIGRRIHSILFHKTDAIKNGAHVYQYQPGSPWPIKL
jgi:hypothetical protein